MSQYLDSVLSRQLSGYGVSEEYAAYLKQVVEAQMLSLLTHWDDIPFRKTVLLIASEEGPFYSPNAKADIKCFVVMTLRNSPFESLQSNVFSTCGLRSGLTDEQVKKLTSSAIEYFNRLDFSLLSREAKRCGAVLDLYAEQAERCPISWNALQHLANTQKNKLFFERISGSEPYRLKGIEEPAPEAQEESKPVKSVLDGYSMEIDPPLSQQLGGVVGSQGMFLVDCFKMLTRNFEKLMQIMEFLLSRGCAFLTSNYYISNGYVERRPRILRAAASSNCLADMKAHFTDTKGLSNQFRQALLQTAEQFKS